MKRATKKLLIEHIVDKRQLFSKVHICEKIKQCNSNIKVQKLLSNLLVKFFVWYKHHLPPFNHKLGQFMKEKYKNQKLIISGSIVTTVS